MAASLPAREHAPRPDCAPAPPSRSPIRPRYVRRVPAPDELLDAVAEALRREIGPAVVDPFARTQAFMAAVVLQKLAGQLRAAPVEVAVDRRALVAAVRTELGATPPAGVTAALDLLGRDGAPAAWRAVVTSLYAARDELGAARFDAALARVRAGLRARLDHVLAYAS
jgi:hypothetical protein